MEKDMIEKFGDTMDEFLKNNRVGMVIELPIGTLEPEIQDSTKLGPVVQMYILMHCMRKVIDQMWDMLDEGKRLFKPEEKKNFVKASLKMIENDILKKGSKEN